MCEKKREEMLNRLCTLLADAELADRQETIMHLMHSARRASRNRESNNATEHCIDALKLLRKARHTLFIAGVETDKLAPVEYAIAQLVPIYDEAREDASAMLFAESYVGRFFAMLALLAIGLIVLYANGWLHT
ncbi:hypothetical protein [Erwinia amylovora]|uniref:hypothetical protein n=1 Tax=Erwinia amylovora TaxID=552 RepID=UPI0011787C84|nr:hypothetical protein [Erwinia amylovora]